jgi:hypothetical protein
MSRDEGGGLVGIPMVLKAVEPTIERGFGGQDHVSNIDSELTLNTCSLETILNLTQARLKERGFRAASKNSANNMETERLVLEKERAQMV